MKRANRNDLNLKRMCFVRRYHNTDTKVAFSYLSSKTLVFLVFFINFSNTIIRTTLK